MRRVPASTYFFTSAGSVSRANLPQYEHLKSAYSIITTGASARPWASGSLPSRRASFSSSGKVPAGGSTASEEAAESLFFGPEDVAW